MEALTTIKAMMANNRISVPRYQRAYSWDTPTKDSSRSTQTDVFLTDLEEYEKSGTKSPYYFGHFLYEKKEQYEFNVIDGQQRLTTIVIFLSALFDRLKEIRVLSTDERICYEDMIERYGIRRFHTVDYDDELFYEYVIEKSIFGHHGIQTVSGKRIVRAYDFFKDNLSYKSEAYLTRLLSIISNAACTTHIVEDESEAIQMFIFQNNRGKLPSNLEIVKAKFMYNVHLYGAGKKDKLLDDLKNRFQKIYKSISKIEYRIDEDDVLLYTLRVHFNSLWESNSLETIDKKLLKEDPIDFIKSFAQSLSLSFEYLSLFFIDDERDSFPIHSLVSLGGIAVAIPFVIKAYRFGLPLSDIENLCASLESLVVRHRLIGTKAYLRSRISDVFENFTETERDIQPIIDRVNYLKSTTDWFWAYWNNEKLNESIQGGIHHGIAKYLLWKYENYLRSKGMGGYSHMRFDGIDNPELEHIAPKTEPNTKPHGYDKYDDVFREQYIECLGNYLLLSRLHNRSVSNDPFPEKHKDYDTHILHQQEIRKMVPDPSIAIWSKGIIQKRKEKLIKFVMDNF